jgi:hypothetical protein
MPTKAPPMVTLGSPVAILDEHELKDDRGKVLGYLSASCLQRIADNHNRLFDETGDEIPLVIGHTDDDSPEKEQPEVVGFASKFQVKKFFNTKKKALYCTWKIYKDKLHLLRKFPRRSVELWLDRWEVDPISLLGATTPDRRLGLVKMAAEGNHLTCEMSGDLMNDSSDTAQEVVALLQQSEVWKFMEQAMPALQQMLGQGQAGGGGEEFGGQADEGELPPEEGEAEDPSSFDEDVDDEVSPEGDDFEMGDEEPEDSFSPGGAQELDPDSEPDLENPVKKQHSATNTSIPTQKMSHRSASHDSLRIKLSRVERQLNTLTDDNRNLRLKLARAVRESDLIQLEAEGFDFDREEELEFVAALPDDRYANHIDRIRKRYSRVPLNGPNGHGAIPTMGPGEMDRRANITKAIDAATASGNPADYDRFLDGGGEKTY